MFALFTLCINYIYIGINAEKYKYDPNLITFAWAFGKDPTALLNDYIVKSQEDIIKQEFQKVSASADTMNTNIQAVDKQVNDLITKTTIQTEKGVTTTKTGNIIDEVTLTATKNIQSLKDALNKLTGSVVLTRYMSDGAIQKTSDFKNTSAYSKLMDLTK
jgi:hypothetical protein